MYENTVHVFNVTLVSILFTSFNILSISLMHQKLLYKCWPTSMRCILVCCHFIDHIVSTYSVPYILFTLLDALDPVTYHFLDIIFPSLS